MKSKSQGLVDVTMMMTIAYQKQLPSRMLESLMIACVIN